VLLELGNTGVLPCPVRFVLPETQVASYKAQPADIDLLHLLGRRATFEYVLRQHVATLRNVSFQHDVRVEGLHMEPEGSHLRVRGVTVTRGATRGATETILADVVIDASGGRGKTPEWLRAGGATIEAVEQPSEFTYFCRHYRMRDGGAEPFARRTGAALDYLWFGAFFAEHGHFSLALACPAAESELVQTIKTAEGFDLIAHTLPGVSELIERAEPTSKVLGAGGLTNRWTRYSVKGKPELLGFFAVGDSHVLTNPMYGRGCTSAFVQAGVLCGVLRESRDPVQRARSYAERVETELKPQYEFAIAGDRLFAARGRRARGEVIPRSMHLVDYLTDQIWAPAAVESPFIARESVKTIQMQAISSFGTRMAVLLLMLFSWVRRGFRTVALVSERTGPSRSELREKLGLSTTATPHE
jgi:2-polyprenyl-6-methoxyphenol hydroxylase-like FAD-dependent oxidoreductase